jgi:hypothetical protein
LWVRKAGSSGLDRINVQVPRTIADLQSAMAALNRDVLPLNVERFAVMAKPH